MSRCKSLASSPKFCHICGLRISSEIVSSLHPLYGTIDHAVPRAAGGKNCKSNRYPAHRVCNATKGSRTEPLPADVVAGLQSTVMAMLRSAGLVRYATRQHLEAARYRLTAQI